MKLRQKLAMVLATAMVITAVPVTTMAASTSNFNKTMAIVADKEITSDSNLFLNVEYAEADKKEAEKGDVFFIEATDFEFTKAAYDHTEDGKAVAGHTPSKGAKVEWLSKTQLKVTAEDGELAIAIVGTPKEGSPAITLDGKGSLATPGKFSLSSSDVVSNKELVATAGDAKNISVDGYGSIADITIEEQVAGSLAGKTISITLPNSSDLIFNSKYANGGQVKIEGKRGLANVATEVTATYAKDDNKKIEITFGNEFKTKTSGSVVLKGIEVQSEDKKGDVDTGEVKVTVKGDKMDDTKLVVANVAEYGVSFKVSEAKELVAGQDSKEIELVVKENAVDSISEKKDIYFTIEEGYFDVDVDEFNKDKDNIEKGISINEDKDEITLDVSKKFKENEVNEFKFKVNVAAKASQKDSVVVVASSKNFEEDLKVEVATVDAAVEVKTEPMTVKAGLKDQVGGKIVITETKEDRLAKNKEIRIAGVDDRYYGFDIKDAKVEVTGGDIEVESEIDKKTGEIVIKVKRSSDEASEITVSEIEVTTDRTIPEGSFDFQVGGTAISKLNEEVKEPTTEKERDNKFDDVIELKEFIVVGTKNTEDLPNAATAKEIVLTVGSTAYTVNGEAKTADAAAFIDASNRTMVPVKFVAEEFGKIDFGTVNGVGTVTIFKDGAVLQFQNGSNIMNKNGINVPMDTKVIIKDGRTYVPFKYVADGLGIRYSYDAATKSITFTNQVK